MCAAKVIQSGKKQMAAALAKTMDRASKKNRTQAAEAGNGAAAEADANSRLQRLEAENKRLKMELMDRDRKIRDLRAQLQHLGVRC